MKSKQDFIKKNESKNTKNVDKTIINDKLSAELERIGLNNAEAIFNKLIELALDGDFNASKYVLERVLPLRKGTRLKLDIPSRIRTAEEVDDASVKTMEMMVNGRISPEEALAISQLLESRARVIEVKQLSDRFEELQKKFELLVVSRSKMDN